jgi:hypothetical protein
VTSQDSFIPLGQAANLVLLQEGEIEAAARALVASEDGLQATGNSDMSSLTPTEGSRASI